MLYGEVLIVKLLLDMVPSPSWDTAHSDSWAEFRNPSREPL